MAASWSATAQGLLLLSVLLLSGGVLSAKPVLEGPARIVDGDTLYIGECTLSWQKQLQALNCTFWP